MLSTIATVAFGLSALVLYAILAFFIAMIVYEAIDLSPPMQQRRWKREEQIRRDALAEYGRTNFQREDLLAEREHAVQEREDLVAAREADAKQPCPHCGA